MIRAYELQTTQKSGSGRAYELTKISPYQPTVAKPIVSKPITFREKLRHLPGALMDVFGFTEAIETIKAPPKAWTDLSFKERAKLYYPEVGKELLKIAEQYPKSAIQFIATPILGVIENITGQPIDDVTLPTKVGKWIGPLSGTNAQILQFEDQGYTYNEARTLVVTQQMAKSLPFVGTFSAPIYIQQLLTKPSTEQILHYQYNKAVSIKANQVVKSAKLPSPTAGDIKTSGGAFEQIVRIKGMPDRYLTIHTDPMTGIKAVQGWDLTDPTIQIPTSAILKGAPEIPMSQVPSGINFVKANPLFSGVDSALKTISIEKSHTLFLEEAVKRVAPILAEKSTLIPPLIPPEIPIDVKPKPEPKPDSKPVEQNIKYNETIDKIDKLGAETLTTNELDTIARGEQTTITPEGKKPITPESETLNKVIDMYAGFPLSKLADIPITFQGTKMSLINTLGKEIIRYHGLTPEIKKLLVKLETVPDLTKDGLEEFFMAQFPISTEEAKQLSYHQENPGENPISPELEPYAERIKSLVDISKTMQISRNLMNEFFPQSFINRANKEITQHQESIASLQKTKAVEIPEHPALEKAHAVKKENTITKHQTTIDELNEYKEFLDGLQYLPHLYLQSETIQNNLLKLMPEGRITAAFRSALSKLKGRKIATMEDAKAMGLIPEEDIRVILASHFDYLYRKSLIYDVIEELKKNPQAILPEDKAPDNWERVAISQLSSYRVHPLLGASITDFAVPDNVGLGGKIYDDVNWLGKAIIFFNPIILPFWDIFQGYAAGSVGLIRTVAAASIGATVAGPLGAGIGTFISVFTQSNMLQAWKDVTGRTKIYEQLVERGVFRTPRVGYFSPPIESSMRVLIDNMDDKYPKWKKAVEKITGKPVDWKTYTVLPDLYQTNWRLTWFLDRVLRTATYRHARNKGMDMDIAAEYTNNFHANYNIFTNRAKRTANRAFLVPTYKVNMLVNLPAYVAKNTFNLAKSVGKGGGTPVQKASLSALIRIMILVAGTLALAKYFGYHFKEGYRLVKKLEKPEISKGGKVITERVITLPGPFAEIPKFIERIKQGPKGLYMYMAKIPQIAWGLSRNARWNGQPYYTDGASPEYQRKEIMVNILKDYVAPVDRISMMTDEETDSIDNILSTFGLATYKRGGTESRILWQITDEKTKLIKFLKRPDVSLKDKKDAQKAYQEKVLKFIDELEDYQKTFK